MITALLAAGTAAGTWLLARPRQLPPAAECESAAAVSVVIPARNEAATLPHLLASIAVLRPAAHEVIVVDDDSDDGTAAVAAAAGATVVQVAPPAGWGGKSYACDVGAQRATGSHLLFVDADVSLAVPALGMLATAHRDRGGLVSVQPHHTPQRRYEELSAYFNAVAMMGSGAFSPRPPSRPAAFGPCLFTSADEYRRIGGHAAVRDEILEDVALARRYAACGLPVTCLAGAEHVRFRMYPGGPRQLVEGWSKNIASGAVAADPVAVAGTVLWVSAHAAVASALGKAVAAAVRRRSPASPWPLVRYMLVGAHLRWVLRRVGSFRASTVAAFPLPLAAFVAIFTRSVLLTRWRGTVTWRGRDVSVGARSRVTPWP